jgi:hypothetical protein
MDNGPELTANALSDWCRFGGTGASYIEPGSPWQNPFVESFGSRVRDEVLSVEAFDSVLEAQTIITDWRKRCSLLARKVSSKRGNFREPPKDEVRRIRLARTWLNTGLWTSRDGVGSFSVVPPRVSR